MERRFSSYGGPATVETREDGTRTISGVGAVFYRDGDTATEYRLARNIVERVAPDAFDRALADGDDARGLFNHDSNHLLGRVSSGTMRLSKGDDGLRYEIDLPDTQSGRDVAASIERGDLTGSSFAFVVDAVEWSEDGEDDVRTIKSVRLFDVGPVTFPAYEGTTTGVRSEGDADEAIASRDEWRSKRRQRNARAKAARARSIDVS